MTGKQKRWEEINKLQSAQGFWDNQDKARDLMAELSRLNFTIKPLSELLSGADDLDVLMEFAQEDDSGESTDELRTTAGSLKCKLAGVELQAMMANPEDACGAFISIQAGEGGTDSSDWSEMLMRMYLRWAERHGFKVEQLDLSAAEEAGIRNVTLAIRGDYVYGKLRSEIGNHRLIRISPFDSAGRRHTSFAAVDVTPELGDEIEIEIDWDKDVREDRYRASGAGGQHVNKTDSAVRLTHLPTGQVTQCQNERSQHKNRSTARKMLKAKLYQTEQDKRDAEVAAKRGEKSKIGFGGQTVRNYVLHPEQYVKDTRTNLKVGNPMPVLDGGIDNFIESYLRWNIGKE